MRLAITESVMTNAFLDNMGNDFHTISRANLKSDAGYSVKEASEQLLHCQCLVIIAPLNQSFSAEDEIKFVGCLLQAAKQVAIQKVVYISSIEVIATSSITPVTELAVPSPTSKLGKVAYHCERLLVNTMQHLPRTEYCLIRAAELYGQGVLSGTVTSVSRHCNKLPFVFSEGIANRRHYLNAASLVDLISTCVTSEIERGEIFNAADSETVSTSQLYRHYTNKCKLIPVPKLAMFAVQVMRSRSDYLKSRFCDLEVDTSKALRVLGWQSKSYFSQQ